VGSFMDRMKDKLHAAGEGAKRLTEVANLKLELGDARKFLEHSYRDLGKACANRMIDRDEAEVFREETSIAHALEEVAKARKKVEVLEAQLENMSGGAREA
jgi:ubiquinone biosynthesis protein UbiJ